MSLRPALHTSINSSLVYIESRRIMYEYSPALPEYCVSRHEFTSKSFYTFDLCIRPNIKPLLPAGSRRRQCGHTNYGTHTAKHQALSTCSSGRSILGATGDHLPQICKMSTYGPFTSSSSSSFLLVFFHSSFTARRARLSSIGPAVDVALMQPILSQRRFCSFPRCMISRFA